MDMGRVDGRAPFAGRAVTIAMDGVQFLKPVKIGDEVSVYGEIVKGSLFDDDCHRGMAAPPFQLEAKR
jgi:acyl dehydratase